MKIKCKSLEYSYKIIEYQEDRLDDEKMCEVKIKTIINSSNIW